MLRASIITTCSLLLTASSAFAADLNEDIAAIWKDPIFQKQFVGSYGINSEIEPRVTPEEVKILEKVRPMMEQVADLPKAEEYLRKQIKPDSSPILDFTLGGIHFQQEKYIDALVAYRSAVEKFPSFRRAHRNMGLIFARDGRYDDAIKSFTKMIKLGGGDEYSYGLLGFAYAMKSDFQAAEAAYRNALLLQPDNTEWRLGLTRCVYKQSKFEDAAALLDSLLERYPANKDFWVLQAHTYLGMKLPLKAAENFEVVDQLGLSDVGGLNTLGDIYISEGLLDLAARAYVRAIRLDTQQPQARSVRAAEVLVSRGATAQARLIIAAIRETFGDNIAQAEQQKLLKLEARLSMADGESNDQTVAVLDDIIKIDPLDGEALMLLGQHYARHNEPDRAIFYYERAASIDAFEANARIRHAQLLAGMGRYTDAVPLLRRAQEIRPRDDVAKYLDQIDRLAKSKR